MDTQSTFKLHLEKIVPIEPNEWEAVCNFTSAAEYRSKAIIERQGDTTGNIYFMTSGIVRTFRVREGREYTCNLYSTPRFIANLNALILNQPADLTIQAMAPTKIVAIKYKDANDLCDTLHKYEHVARIFLEQIIMQEVSRVKELTCFQPYERFQNLMNDTPELMNLIPQKYIASYLGISPESLSRMKAKISAQI